MSLKTLVNGALKGTRYELVKRFSPGSSFDLFESSSVAQKREQVSTYIAQKTGCVVQAGPFRGMKLAGETPPSNYLVGSCEAQLHPALENMIAVEPRTFVNVGAYEGYYCVGLKRRLPQTNVIAYEASASAFERSKRNCALNHADVDLRGLWGVDDLIADLNEDPRAALLIDCEGYEDCLLDVKDTALFAQATFLIECHDFIKPSISEKLRDLLEPSHHIETIYEADVDFSYLPIMRKLSQAERFLAVYERRVEAMSWLFAVPKAA